MGVDWMLMEWNGLVRPLFHFSNSLLFWWRTAGQQKEELLNGLAAAGRPPWGSARFVSFMPHLLPFFNSIKSIQQIAFFIQLISLSLGCWACCGLSSLFAEHCGVPPPLTHKEKSSPSSPASLTPSISLIIKEIGGLAHPPIEQQPIINHN